MEELKGQAAEALPPVIRLAADVVAGGDTKKLFDMMEKGLLDPMTLIPKITQKMREESEGQMEMYWASLRYNQGMALRNQQQFTKKFLEAGGERGLTRVFSTWAYIIKETMSSTKQLGQVFDSASRYLSAAMLVPLETFQWLKGEAKDGNFMQVLFGDVTNSEFVNSIKYAMTEIEKAITESMGGSLISVESTVKELEYLSSIVSPIFEAIGDAAEQFTALNTGGMEAFRKVQQRQLRRDSAREQANEMADSLEAEEHSKGNYSFRVPASVRKKYARIIEQDLETSGQEVAPQGLSKLDSVVARVISGESDNVIPVPDRIENPLPIIRYIPVPPGWTSPRLPNLTGQALPMNLPQSNDLGVAPSSGQVMIMNSFNYSFGDVGSNIDLNALKDAMETTSRETFNSYFLLTTSNAPNVPN